MSLCQDKLLELCEHGLAADCLLKPYLCVPSQGLAARIRRSAQCYRKSGKVPRRRPNRDREGAELD